MPALHTATVAVAPFHNDRNLPCRQIDPETFFPDPGRAGTPQRNAAKAACRTCPRAADCLAWALATHEVSHGIWGGTTPDERRAMLRRDQQPTSRPQPPPRAAKPTPTADVDKLRRLFDAAADFLTHGDTKQVVCARWRVASTKFAEAVAIVRWCPDLVDDVVDGWRSFAGTYRHAQQVRVWAETHPDEVRPPVRPVVRTRRDRAAMSAAAKKASAARVAETAATIADLHGRGHDVTAIARLSGHSRRTVHRYLRRLRAVAGVAA